MAASEQKTPAKEDLSRMEGAYGSISHLLLTIPIMFLIAKMKNIIHVIQMYPQKLFVHRRKANRQAQNHERPGGGSERLGR
jgi:hypothetical protein